MAEGIKPSDVVTSARPVAAVGTRCDRGLTKFGDLLLSWSHIGRCGTPVEVGDSLMTVVMIGMMIVKSISNVLLPVVFWLEAASAGLWCRAMRVSAAGRAGGGRVR